MKVCPLLTQIAISFGTSLAVAVAIEWWLARRARLPLPQAPAAGVDHV